MNGYPYIKYDRGYWELKNETVDTIATKLEGTITDNARDGFIDDPANLGSGAVYITSGTRDYVVPKKFQEAINLALSF